MKISYRKIQLVGGKTYSINLPIDWINNFNLKKGSILKIEEEDNGDLIIHPPLERNVVVEKKYRIYTSPSLSRDITRAYLLGFRTIEIISKSNTGFTSQENEEIELSCRKFPGAEIGSDEKTRKVIRIIASFDVNEPYSLIHTMFGLTIGMLERIVNIFQKDKKKSQDYSLKEEIERIIEIDQKVNRNFFLIVRQLRALIQESDLRKKLDINTIRIMDYRLISHLLENLGDNCVRICESMLSCLGILKNLIDSYNEEEPDMIFKALISISSNMKEFLQGTFDSFIRNDYKKAESLIEIYGSLGEYDRYIQECRSKSQRSDFMIIFYRFYDIQNILRDICDLIQPIESLKEI